MSQPNPYHDLADTIDGYIQRQPNVSNLTEVDNWMRQVQSLSATLAQYSAEAEAEYCAAMMEGIKRVDADTWNRIKNSSTLVSQYMAGLYRKQFEAWQRLHKLQSVLKTVMDNCRTLIVTARHQEEMFKAGQVRNSAPMDQSSLPFN